MIMAHLVEVAEGVARLAAHLRNLHQTRIVRAGEVAEGVARLAAHLRLLLLGTTASGSC